MRQSATTKSTYQPNSEGRPTDLLGSIKLTYQSNSKGRPTDLIGSMSGDVAGSFPAVDGTCLGYWNMIVGMPATGGPVGEQVLAGQRGSVLAN